MTNQQALIADLIAAKLGYTGPMEQLHAILQLWADAGQCPAPSPLPPVPAPTPDPVPAPAAEPPVEPEQAEPEQEQRPSPFYATAAALPDDDPDPIASILPRSRSFTSDDVKSVKGFLHLRCKSCGQIHTFCAKQPIFDYTCRSCGEVTQLSNITCVKQVCECGNVSKYYTNLDEWYFDLPCVNCKAPAADVVEVVHGRWVKRPNTKGQVYCSECATLEKITDSNFRSKHCPNCGARMDGE